MNIKQLTEHVSVSEQINLADLNEIKTLGFKTVVNNRPDGEVLDQPEHSQIQTMCDELDLQYYFIPVSSQGLSIDEIQQYKKVYQSCDKPILAFCRTGTRSTVLWGLMQASFKEDLYTPEIIKGVAKNAGYDLTNVDNGLKYLFETGC